MTQLPKSKSVPSVLEQCHLLPVNSGLAGFSVLSEDSAVNRVLAPERFSTITGGVVAWWMGNSSRQLWFEYRPQVHPAVVSWHLNPGRWDRQRGRRAPHSSCWPKKMKVSNTLLPSSHLVQKRQPLPYSTAVGQSTDDGLRCSMHSKNCNMMGTRLWLNEGQTQSLHVCLIVR